MASVTGLGGVFYKVGDPDRTRAWYLDNLGLGGEWGIMFPWRHQAGALAAVGTPSLLV
jgi:hypothetical protein